MALFNFSHFIQVWLAPQCINFVLILSGFLFLRRYSTFGKSLIITGLVSLYLLSMPIISKQLIKFLENQYPPLPNEFTLHKNNKSAILVLGGGNRQAPEYGNTWVPSTISFSRISYAAHLHKKFLLPIIVSGGITDNSLQSEAEIMSDALKNTFHIYPVLKEEKSLNTADESKFVIPILKSHDIHTVFLVTHAMHMPRSVYIFKKAGINVIPAPMGYLATSSKRTLTDFLPSEAALSGNAIAFHEYIGLLWYYMYYHEDFWRIMSSS